MQGAAMAADFCLDCFLFLLLRLFPLCVVSPVSMTHACLFMVSNDNEKSETSMPSDETNPPSESDMKLSQNLWVNCCIAVEQFVSHSQ